MNRKPRLFIGSSVESLPIADAINENLDHTVEATIWRTGTFKVGSTTIDDLLSKAKEVDFAVFIFSPDDITNIREQEHLNVRDNVVFELGLFIGALGKSRCYIVKPRGVALHIPTDLLGITSTDYDENRSDRDLTSALNRSCSLIKKEMDRIGIIRQDVLTKDSADSARTFLASSEPVFDSELSVIDLSVLLKLLATHTSDDNGLSSYEIKRDVAIKGQYIDLAIIKLLKFGMIERRNEMDIDGTPYYGYKITQDGINSVVKNEQQLLTLVIPPNLSSASRELPF